MAVRNESVRLSLEDDYTTKVARATAATALLRHEVDNLGGTSVRTSGSVGPLGNDIDHVGASARRADSDINKLTGRLALFRDLALIAGPAAAPLGAAAVGGLVALSAQLGATVGAIGVTVLAVSGLGDGLKALDQYQLDPTAENLVKLQEELKKVGPAGEDFVRFLDSIEPNLKTLQNAAREGLLPGAEDGIAALLQRLPELRKLVRLMATDLGDLAADAGEALAGERFDAFFKYLRTDGIKILDDTGRAVGNLVETVANLFVAFGGVSTDFSGGLLKFTEGLAEASANLETNEGFIKFVDYIETEGPHALETLGSLANMFLQIVEATAPLGGPVLTILGKFADIIAAIADSDLGTPLFAGLAALALYNRALGVTAALNKTAWGGAAIGSLKAFGSELSTVTTAQDRARMSAIQLDKANAASAGAWRGGLSTIGKGAAVVGGLALATSGLAESSGLSNSANLALIGTIAGPWGTALGAGAGMVLDFKAANDKGTDSVETFRAALKASQGDLVAQQELIDGMREAAERAADDVDTDGFFEGFKNAFDPDVIVSDFKSSFGMDTAAQEMAGAADEAQSALDNLKAGIPTLTSPLAGLARGTREAAEAEQEQTAAIEGSIDAMRAKRQEALRGANAQLNYQAAIDEANKSIKDNGKNFDITTEKGRANRQALYALADGWNQQSDAAKNAKGSLKAARDNFIDTATQMGATADQAKKLANRLFEIPTKRQIDITLDDHGANAELVALKARIDAIKGKTVNVTVNTVRPQGGQAPTEEQVSGPAPKTPKTSRTGAPRTSSPLDNLATPRLADLAAAGNTAYALRHDDADAPPPGSKGGGGSSDGGGGYKPFLAINEAAHAAHDAASGLKALRAELSHAEKALNRSEKALDRETRKRDQLADAMASIAASVSSGLRSDVFAENSDPWAAAAGGVAGVNAGLQGDIDQGQSFTTLLAALQGRGLHGGALQALLEQAAQKNDLGLLQQFAGANSSDLANYQSLYDLRDQVLGGAGTATGQAIFGEAYAAQTKVLEEQRDETKGLRKDVREVQKAIERMDKNQTAAQEKNAQQVAAGVNGGAAHGKDNQVYVPGGPR